MENHMNLSIAKIREQRPLQELIRFSIINIDKPTGPTSFSVSQFVKDKLKLNKTSHFGTLDPMVSGVLPVGLGRACRLSDYFMHSDKEYVGIMRLHKEVSDDVLEKEVKNFIGKIKQMPPIRSRVKRAFREREVKSFRLLERQGKDILFISNVEAGTYIRKLIHDIGEKIGGAHMLELRRVKASIFREEDSLTLYEFEKAVDLSNSGDESLLRKILIPADYAISLIMPAVQIKEESLKQALTGKPIFKNDLFGEVFFDKGISIAVFCGDKLVQVARVINEKDLIAKPEFVYN